MSDPKSELSLVQQVGWRFGIQFVTSERCAGGFSGVDIFRAQTEDGQLLAVRRTPLAFDDSSELSFHIQRQQFLHRLLGHVHQQGVEQIPVPMLALPDGTRGIIGTGRTPIAASSIQNEGSASIWRTDSDLWQLEPWMPGHPKVRGELTAAHVANALNCLHRFHTSAADFAARSNQNPWFQLKTACSPAVLRRLALTNELLQRRLNELEVMIHRDSDPEVRQTSQQMCRVLHQRLPGLKAELDELSVQTFSLQPVIRDLWSAHILFSDDRITGLIDLTAAGTDHIVADLTRLGRSWFGADTECIAQMVQRFQEHRRLNPDELRLLRVLDECTVMLSPVTWMNRRYRAHGEVIELSRPSRLRLQQLIRTAVEFESLPLLN